MKTNLLYAGALVLGLSALVACAAPTPVPPTPAPTPTAASNTSAILTLTAPKAQSSVSQPASNAPRVLPQATIRVGNLDRIYLYYVPANLPRNAPLLFALHAYQGVDAEQMRAATAYEFESLADQNGFVVVYPQGYQISWNECPKAGGLSENAKH